MKIIVISLFFIPLCLFAEKKASKEASIKPTHYWSLDEPDGKTLKDSAGNADGVLIKKGNAPLPGRVEGVDGKAIKFKNKIRHAARFKNVKLQQKQFTLMCWFKPNHHGLLYVLQAMAGDLGKLTHGYALAHLWNGILLFEIVPTKGKNIKLRTPAGTVNKEDNGQWTHLAVTKSPKAIKIYVNFEVKAEHQLKTDFSIKRNSRGLYVGRHYYNLANPLEGTIDEIKIYDKCLKPEQIISAAAINNSDN
jgi:Concanavalin A-like lectin/glucanases superfamily